MKNTKDLTVLSSRQLVAEYARLAHARGESAPRVANRAYEDELRIRRELRSRGASDYALLLGLMKSPDPWVRLDSAIPALFIAPQEAEAVLEQLLAEHRGALAATAGMTLTVWRRGELKQL